MSPVIVDKPDGPLSAKEILEIEKRIGISFRTKKLLQDVLIHRSYLNHCEYPNLASYERLEFLGDSVLTLVVCQHLFRHFPMEQEGKLTTLKAALVSNDTLGEVTEQLHLDLHLRADNSLLRDFDEHPQSRTYVLACIFEALIGAIFLDRGLGTAELFVEKFLFPKLEQILAEGNEEGPKSLLQSLAQEKFRATPEYEVLETSGKGFSVTFHVGAYIGTELVGKGKGTSKKRAQVEAAKNALQLKFGLNPTSKLA